MKKFAIYLKWINTFLSLGIGYLILRQFIRLFDLIGYDDEKRELFFGIRVSSSMNDIWYLIVSIFSCGLLIYLIFILNTFRKVTKDLLKNQIFIKENGIQLKKVGKGLFVFGIVLVSLQIGLKLGFSFDDFMYNGENVKPGSAYESGYTFGYGLGVGIGSLFRFLMTTGFPIFMASLFMFVIAHFVEEGHYLKEENDLTI